MFDVGFSELLLLGVIALVVLGPEKLPHAARMAGAWLGKIKRAVVDIQAEIEKEVSSVELKQRMNDEIEKLKALSNPINEEIKAIENSIHQPINHVSAIDAAPAYLAAQQATLNQSESIALVNEFNTSQDEPSTDNKKPISNVNLIKSK